MIDQVLKEIHDQLHKALLATVNIYNSLLETKTPEGRQIRDNATEAGAIIDNVMSDIVFIIRDSESDYVPSK